MGQSDKWQITTLAHEAPDLVVAWAAYHLSLGADHIWLHLDQPNAELSAIFDGHPRITVRVCDDAFWSNHPAGPRPQKLGPRQVALLQHMVDTTETDWLFHIDVDEFLCAETDLGEALGALPDTIHLASVRTSERYYIAEPAEGTILDGVFRRQTPGRITQNFDGALSDCLDRGMTAYVGGKSAFRPGIGLKVWVHGLKPPNSEVTQHLEGTELLHFDGLTPEHWINKRVRLLHQQPNAILNETAHRRAQMRAMAPIMSNPAACREFYLSLKKLTPSREAALKEAGLLFEKTFDVIGPLDQHFPDVSVDLSPAAFNRFNIVAETELPTGLVFEKRAQHGRKQGLLTCRPLDTLPDVPLGIALSADGDALVRPALPSAPKRRGWLEPFGSPYLLVLKNPVLYPPTSLPDGKGDGETPAGMGRKKLGLVVGDGGTLYPDSFGKSKFLPPALSLVSEDYAKIDLPEPADTVEGTHLFAELFFGHFGHALTDMPSRLWPLASDVLHAGTFDKILGFGMLGAGEAGATFPTWAQKLMEAYGADRDRTQFIAKPTRIERLIIPRRIAPFLGLMHPVFHDLTARAGSQLAAQAVDRDRPTHVFLSRSRLSHDPRAMSDGQALDQLFEARGFSVVHPQELPLSEQVALVQTATHIAGPTGSQMHLCGFARQEGVKVFTLAPSYFTHDINQKLINSVGGKETVFEVPGTRPKGPAHMAPWQVPTEAYPRLTAEIEAWLKE